MSGKGYIKIYRRINDWEYRHDMMRLGFWMHLLLSANWKGPDRGSFLTSVRTLKEETGLAKNTIMKYLRELEDLQQIARETFGKKTKITVLNYAEYQGGTGHDLRQSDKLPVTICDDIGHDLRRSEGSPSLLNRRTEEYLFKKEEHIRSSVSARDLEKWFSEFWEIFPKKKAKAAAEKAFRKVCTSEDDYMAIMDGLRRVILLEWQNTEPRYIPHAATWLNGRRWEDEITERKLEIRQVPVSDYIRQQIDGTLPEGKPATDEAKKRVKELQENITWKQ